MNYESFCEDDKTLDACCMQLQHIWECWIKMAKLTNSHYKDLPFSLMKGYRNRITHDYIWIDEEIVWAIIKKISSRIKKIIKIITHFLYDQPHSCDATIPWYQKRIPW